MARSAVLTGLVTQRDRAHLRGRLDRRRARTDESADPVVTMTAWLRMHVTSVTIETAEAMDLTGFLRATAAIDLEPEERLRHLAIHAEHALARLEHPRAWLALDRIYLEAVRANPRAIDVYVSRAVSAHECAESTKRRGDERTPWVESPARRRMMSVAHASIAKANELCPGDAGVLRRVADLLYFDPDHTPAEALPWYERAIERDPSETWAVLYRAHCLQDLERWREAAMAYDGVDAAFFVRERAWRWEILLEQRAYCWMRCGETSRARSEFELLLARWQRDPGLTRLAFGGHVKEAIGTVLPDSDRARLDAVLSHSVR